MKNRSHTKKTLINITFVLVCAGLLLFLYLAPEETTTPLPEDEVHLEFHHIESKKEADAHCSECHSEEGGMPLSEQHPDPYRCLFCHKR